ncbi:MAG: hypothetical protein KatS3mg114_0004 [Planctomycetaceae bacterium]|nr:MAG: hypothetical protein KatS3mg114_0004 [Planctomycetaceae bacterium]
MWWGATDRHAAEVTSNPVSPKDLLATLYHLLGIDPHHMLRDRTGRTIPLVPDEARVLHEVLS